MSYGGKGCSNDHTLENGKSRNIVAKQIGVSSTTFERAKKVIELASPELKEKVRSGQTSINYAYKKVNRVEKKKKMKC